MESTNLFIIVVFVLGVSVGGLTVSLHRQCTIERIKSDFERQLRDIVRSVEAADQQKIASSSTAEQRSTAIEDADPEDESWDYLPPAQDYRPGITHTSV